jgi:hypothetical protein
MRCFMGAPNHSRHPGVNRKHCGADSSSGVNHGWAGSGVSPINRHCPLPLQVAVFGDARLPSQLWDTAATPSRFYGLPNPLHDFAWLATIIELTWVAAGLKMSAWTKERKSRARMPCSSRKRKSPPAMKRAVSMVPGGGNLSGCVFTLDSGMRVFLSSS